LRVGLIGCGFIGESIAKAIDRELESSVELVVIYDEIRERAVSLSRKLLVKPRIAGNFEEVISDPGVQLIIEAASQSAARTIAPKALASGKQVMIMSVGALADDKFREEIKNMASQMHVKVHIPSGAIGGLDWIKAASAAGLDQVTITSRKPPKALEGAPYVIKNKIDLTEIKCPTQIYEGPASDAAFSFPANVNVAVALSLAGVGSNRTLVRVIADPTVRQNIHEISAEGAAGKLTVRVENTPAPDNPKTSWIAALSAIQKLREISSAVSLGT
jgi:aspartate dehydrogenase